MQRNEIVSGSRFPDLELPDHVGNLRKLSDLAWGNPLLLQFYRGWWCAKEQAFFGNLVLLQDEAEVAYTSQLRVDQRRPFSGDCRFRAGLGARWTFLSDEDRRGGSAGLREVTDPGNSPYLPTVPTLLPDRRSTPCTTATGSGTAVERGTAPRLPSNQPADPR